MSAIANPILLDFGTNVPVWMANPRAAFPPGVYETLPYSLKIFAENLLRTEKNAGIVAKSLSMLAMRARNVDFPFRPGRVVLQDLLGTPVLVDLAGLRDAVALAGGDPTRVNPVVPTHLVIDHSLNVDHWGHADAMGQNMALEQSRNAERFAFLDWANKAFDRVDIIRSGTGILHQINLEKLTPVIAASSEANGVWAYPDTLVGTDSHTTMINAAGVLGWGVGGIEAEAAMLGLPLTLRLPEIVGVRLEGQPVPGVIATDLALACTEILRAEGVVGAILEFHGPGAAKLSLPDRATIANMAPEYGATAALFALDDTTLDYLRMTGRPAATIDLVEAYARAQGLWHDQLAGAKYDRLITLDLARLERAAAGPKQPHQRIPLRPGKRLGQGAGDRAAGLQDGSIVIAAITSCTNTANPQAMIAAGLLARRAHQRGLRPAAWTKTSLAPGSRVVADYLTASGLMQDLDALGFQLVGFGCTTCNGMSGPLVSPELGDRIRDKAIDTVAVTSGNRNFEGRIHPLARRVFIMSPPLVVAYALAGTVNLDIDTDPLGHDAMGIPVYLRDLWPDPTEITGIETEFVTAACFTKAYQTLTAPLPSPSSGQTVPARYPWDESSTYIRHPPYWQGAGAKPPADFTDLRALVILGDDITTDHISPSGAILPESDAGRYLIAQGIGPAGFNSYGTRRGNHEIGMRAAFASPRLKNEMLGTGAEGPLTRIWPEDREISIFEAARQYQARDQGLIIIAGRHYGSGSSRDWAAKGPKLLGVRAVIAESYERIHRQNLAGMGVLPLEFIGETRLTLQLSGAEIFEIQGLGADLEPGGLVTLVIHRVDGTERQVSLRSRLDTADELSFFRHGGLLPQLLVRQLASAKLAST